MKNKLVLSQHHTGYFGACHKRVIRAELMIDATACKPHCDNGRRRNAAQRLVKIGGYLIFDTVYLLFGDLRQSLL